MAIGTPVERYAAGLAAQDTETVFSPASNLTVGTHAILSVLTPSQNKPVASVTDTTGGNTWTVDATMTANPPGVAISSASCKVLSSITTGHSITVTYAVGGSIFASVALHEVSGLATSPFDKTANDTTTTGTAMSAGTTAVLSQADEIVFAEMQGFSFAGVTKGATWNLLDCGDSNILLEYKIVAATTAVTPDGTQGGSAASGGLTVTYKGAAVGQTLYPDADVDAGTWATAPLWSKVDEAAAGGDVISSTAS